MSRHHLPAVTIAVSILLIGCHSAPSNTQAVAAYYRYDFTDARAALRRDAYEVNDEQVLLDNLRLGIASLADGDLDEAERSLLTSFELLSTAGLNADRTTAAVLVHEGVRVWKGEPFEQALAYHYIALLFAMRGDYENARAAAANALFRLRDFGRDQVDAEYTAVDSSFALGFLMQAIATRHSGLGSPDPQLDAAVAIDPRLASIVETIRAGRYDTILLLDYGKGPVKQAFGGAGELSRYVPVQGVGGPIHVTVDNEAAVSAVPVCDVNAMAVELRWNSLESVRRLKAGLGEAMLLGGTIALHTAHGDHAHEGVLLGLGLLAGGLITRAGARADTRHLELAPQSIYLVPLQLGQRSTLRITVGGDPNAVLVLPDVEPGTSTAPRTLYARLFGGPRVSPPWLAATELRYTNDHAPPRDATLPWILGGDDCSGPSRAVLETYHAAGLPRSVTLQGLRDLYAAEDILIGSGRERGDDRLRNPSFRHILDGGRALFTPHPYTMGYKRLMYSSWPAYEPRSDQTRRLAAACERSGALASQRLQETSR